MHPLRRLIIVFLLFWPFFECHAEFDLELHQPNSKTEDLPLRIANDIMHLRKIIQEDGVTDMPGIQHIGRVRDTTHKAYLVTFEDSSFCVVGTSSEEDPEPVWVYSKKMAEKQNIRHFLEENRLVLKSASYNNTWFDLLADPNDDQAREHAINQGYVHPPKGATLRWHQQLVKNLEAVLPSWYCVKSIKPTGWIDMAGSKNYALQVLSCDGVPTLFRTDSYSGNVLPSPTVFRILGEEAVTPEYLAAGGQDPVLIAYSEGNHGFTSYLPGVQDSIDAVVIGSLVIGAVWGIAKYAGWSWSKGGANTPKPRSTEDTDDDGKRIDELRALLAKMEPKDSMPGDDILAEASQLNKLTQGAKLEDIVARLAANFPEWSGKSLQDNLTNFLSRTGPAEASIKGSANSQKTIFKRYRAARTSFLEDLSPQAL